MAIVLRKNKNGSITYQVKVKDPDGNWYPCRAFASKFDAKEEELRLIQRKRKGLKALSADARSITLNEYWEVWSVENRVQVSRGWRITQDQMYRDFIQPVLGRLTLAEIDTPQIGRALHRVKDLGKSDQTRKHVYSLIRTMFRDAVEYYEMLSISPVKPLFHRPEVKKAERRFLHPKQSLKLLEEARGSYLGAPTWLAILAALRISEIQGLKGVCLDFESDQILIQAAFNNKTREMQDFPKQGDWARVPMPPMLKEFLMELGVGPDDFVAPGPKDEMLSYATYLKALERLCQRAGVPVVTPHELRHSATELYIQAGASSEDIRRLLNHASLSATQNYIHRTDDRLSAIAGQVGKPMLTVIEGNRSKSFPNSFPNGKKEAEDQTETERHNAR